MRPVIIIIIIKAQTVIDLPLYGNGIENGRASSLNVFKTRLSMIRNTRMGFFMD